MCSVKMFRILGLRSVKNSVFQVSRVFRISVVYGFFSQTTKIRNTQKNSVFQAIFSRNSFRVPYFSRPLYILYLENRVYQIQIQVQVFKIEFRTRNIYNKKRILLHDIYSKLSKRKLLFPFHNVEIDYKRVQICHIQTPRQILPKIEY